MPKLVITGDGSSKSTDVSDPSEAVRMVSSSLRLVATDKAVLKALQTWADGGFKRALSLKIRDKAMVIDYRS